MDETSSSPEDEDEEEDNDNNNKKCFYGTEWAINCTFCRVIHHLLNPE